MRLDEFHADIQAFTQATTADEITALCRAFGERLGFNAFVYALRIPTKLVDAQLVIHQTYPVAWTEHYLEHRYYDVDPVLEYCTTNFTPLTWDRVQREPGSEAASMMNMAEDFGLRAGVSMPVHSPFGELGILSFAIDQGTRDAQQTALAAVPHVQLLSAYLHEAVRRVERLAVSAPEAELTMRELECLRWVADGKSSWAIGQIMSLSERTVNFHIERAMGKLNVCNRQHAVAKAIVSGLLQPRPF